MIAALMIGVLATWARPAEADELAGKAKRSHQAYWSVAFLGGMLSPRAAMNDDYKRGLAAGGRLGWTGKMGFGVDLTVNYSPLPRNSTSDPATGARLSYDTHFGLSTLAPRFTLRWKALRLWGAGGGGLAIERTTTLLRDQQMGKLTGYAPAAVGSAGLELHLLSSGGLAFVASYARVYGDLGPDDLRYEFYDLTGGLVFVFR